jgi:APA family basic amino acid/polyamine antiporter
MQSESGVSHDPQPPRVIGPLQAFSVVAGSMLGVGIFLFAPEIAANMGSELGFLAMIIFGGVFAWAGSVACGELGAMMPRAGGDYVYQREAFGPSLAFASGWVLFVAIFAGSTASMSVAVFHYDIGPLTGIDFTEVVAGHITTGHLAALGLIVLLTIVNDLGADLSANIQTLLTISPIIALVVIGVWGLTIGDWGAAAGTAAMKEPVDLGLTGLASAFMFTNFIFSGWINIIYVAAEVKDPGRTIPRSMVTSTAAVTALYVLLGASFMAVLGFGGLTATREAGTAMADSLGGETLRLVVLLIITVAIITSINATILAAARVGYAMARDGAFVKVVGRLSPTRGTPRIALWVQAAIALLLVLSGTFETIVKMTSIAMFVTGALTVASVFVLRRKRPELPRPYRATLYPLLPGLYVVLAVGVIIIATAQALDEAQKDLSGWFPLLGVGILGLAWAGHLLFRRNMRGALGVLALFALGLGALGRLGDPLEAARAATQNAAHPFNQPSEVAPDDVEPSRR